MNNSFTLSEEQNEIIRWFESGKGNLVVTARAGSAKTFTSIAGLNAAKVPSALYAIFNKKNQIEAEGKIKNSSVAVRTLHSLGYGYILSNWKGVRGDSWTERNRVKAIAPDAPAMVLFQTSKLVSLVKNLFVMPTLKDITETAKLRDIDCGQKHTSEGWTIDKMAEIVEKVIQVSLEYPKDKKISFDDMVFLPVAKGWVKKQYDLVTIDECQDMNLLQLTMAIASCNDGGRVCLVGDDMQSMYNFRGACSNGMEKFKQELCAKELTLTTSYRCPRKIIALAQALVPDIKSAPGAIEGQVEQINLDKALGEAKVGNAFLSRTNAPLMKNCLALIRKGVAAYVEGRDVATTLLNIVNQLQANTIGGFVDNIQRWQDAQAAKATGIFANQKLDLIADQAETLKVIAESCIEFADIEKKINSLFQDSAFVRVPSVVFSTVHRGKGLEWPKVFILSGTFKSRRKTTPEEAKEERNIYYVALTRAKECLCLVSDT